MISNKELIKEINKRIKNKQMSEKELVLGLSRKFYKLFAKSSGMADVVTREIALTYEKKFREFFSVRKMEILREGYETSELISEVFAREAEVSDPNEILKFLLDWKKQIEKEIEKVCQGDKLPSTPNNSTVQDEKSFQQLEKLKKELEQKK